MKTKAITYLPTPGIMMRPVFIQFCTPWCTLQLCVYPVHENACTVHTPIEADDGTAKFFFCALTVGR